MVNRYGYIWEYLIATESGEDEDGNPISYLDEWIPFNCDIQTSSGNFVAGVNGDKISVTYSIFTPANIENIVRVRDDKGNEFTVLQYHDYKINREIWV
jgi:hypothetical protein